MAGNSEIKLQLVIEALSRTDAAFNDLKRHLKDAQGETDELHAKSKNLDAGIGSLIARYISLTAAVAGVGMAARSAISYLAQIETATLGIASAYMTGGKYIDAMSGKALAAQDALKAAQGDAKDIIGELQYANLQTIATLDQLIVAYQVTLPVALAKGFNRNQVKEFTVAMVQAAGAIGLQMNQLGEETRSLLTGAIDPRNSRIATVLGLRNEDINQYKGNANGLFNFLMEKLSAYQVAGIESQKTWAGLWSNTKDIVLQALGKAGEPLFEALKYELTILTNSIVTIDEKTKSIKWNPEFLSGVNSFRDGLRDIVAEMYRMGMLLDRIGGTMAMFKGDSKMNDMFRQRYMASEKALQDMAMGVAGWKPVTPDIDQQMREAASKGKKPFEQTLINVGNPDEATQQLLRYYREIGGGKKPDWQGNPPAPDEAELKKANKERTEMLVKLWDKINDINEKRTEEEDKFFAKRAKDKKKQDEEVYLKEMELFDLREKENAEYLKKMPAELKAAREAEINGQLAELDVAEKLGRAHSETLTERIRLQKELLASQEQTLAGLDQHKDAAGWNAQNDKVIGTLKAIADLSREIAMQNPFGAMSLGLKDVANEAMNTGKQLYDAITKAFSGMTDALTDFVMTGKLNFADLANSIIRDMIRIMIQAQITGPLANAAGNINWGGLFGAGMNTGAPAHVGAGGTTAFGMHTGGMGNEPTFYRIIPNLDMLPRNHKGIGPGERLTVTTDDESTMTPGQRRDFFKMASQYGGGNGAPQSVRIEVIDKSGAKVSASAPEVRFDAQEMVVSFVLDAIEHNKFGMREAFGR